MTPPLRVLFLTHRLPYAPNRGDRIRAHFLLRALRGFAEVDVLSLVHDREEASRAGEMGSLASSVRVVSASRRRGLVRSAAALPTERPLTHTMLDGPALLPTLTRVVREHRPDVVLAYCSGMARLAFEPPLRDIPFVLDMVDVDSAKWAALAGASRPPMQWVYSREARVLERFEARAARAAFANLVVTRQEADTLASIAPGARIDVIANGVDVASLAPQGLPPDARSVVFCGVMNYAPNEHAARLLARDVWPLVRRACPDATLTIVGSHPSRATLALADDSAGVTVTGAVPDVRPYLWSAAVAAAPIVTARGIQNKVLEAVAAGLPTVVTPNIMATLPPAVLPACISADTAESIAEAIIKLFQKSPVERRAMAQRADARSLTWEQQLLGLQPLIEQAARTRRED